jgi:nitrogen fixation/metabolism regulation signal transduction histidine kinase
MSSVPRGVQMQPKMRRTFSVFAPGISLRRRVAFSLAIVRLILAPVILIAVFYLFEMGWIVDRIVSVDAPAATLAQQASIQMLEARRAERNFFLLYDSVDVKENQDSLTALSGSLNQIRNLQPEEQATVDNALYAVALYQQRFAAAVSYLSQPGEAQRDRIQSVLRNYETNLNNVVEQNSRKSRAKLVDELRSQVDSFDTQIMSTLQATDPKLRQVAGDLDTSSHEVFTLTSTLEAGNWQRVQDDHKRAQKLLHRAEWVLSIVSALTILLSVWVSVILPRQVVKPLLMLKEAIDHAISGNYQIEFELQGKGEVVELAKSVRTLIAHFTATRQPV